MNETVRILDNRSIPVAGTWVLDPTHTTIEAVARHLMVSKVRGKFGSFSGTITVAERAEESSVTVTIDAASIDTGTEDRDNHLRSADFLDVDNHPTLTFHSTSVEPAGDGWKLTGDLTMLGVTKPIVLDLEFLGVTTDPWGNTKAAFEAHTEIDRRDWGLSWNVPLDQGGLLVSEKLKIEIVAQAALQQ